MKLFWRKSPEDKLADQVTREYLTEGERLADAAMEKQFVHFMQASMTLKELGTWFDEQEDSIFIWFELQFLWGFFHEYVQTQDFPTNGYSRIMTHLMHRLMKKHGRTLQQAREEALEMDTAFSRDNGTFNRISSLGKQAFHDESLDDAMSAVFFALATR